MEKTIEQLLEEKSLFYLQEYYKCDAALAALRGTEPTKIIFTKVTDQKPAPISNTTKRRPPKSKWLIGISDEVRRIIDNYPKGTEITIPNLIKQLKLWDARVCNANRSSIGAVLNNYRNKQRKVIRRYPGVYQKL